MASAGCVILSKYSIDHEDFGKTLIALAVQEVSEQSVWLWTCSLLQHIEPQEIVCLETQASPIYENAYGYEAYPFLRMLATSSVAEEVEMEVPVHILETPRFLNGVPAALLTHVRLPHETYEIVHLAHGNFIGNRESSRRNQCARTSASRISRPIRPKCFSASFRWYLSWVLTARSSFARNLLDRHSTRCIRKNNVSTKKEFESVLSHLLRLGTSSSCWSC